MNWVEKYRPKKFEEIKGQDEAVAKVKTFIDKFNLEKSSVSRSKKKALILHGPPGTGKTAIAYVVANESNSEIFELNASDLRNKEKLNEILRPAMEQQSLNKKNKIILIDEVDGISEVDREGVSEIVSIIEPSQHPVIMTANDVWSKKLSPLRQRSELISFKEISYSIIKDVLINLLKNEKLFIDKNILSKISINAKGDVRAAVNDLETISKLKNPETVEFAERDKEVDIFNVMRLIFKGKPNRDVLNIFDSVGMSLDEAMLWIEENIPAEYHGEELVKAYRALSNADLFKGRIYKQQYWRFLVYEGLFLSYAISAAKKDVKTGFTTYKKPSRILKIWMHNQKTTRKKTIAQKYARLVHVGEKRILRDFPIIKNIIKSDVAIQKELRLSEDELEYLSNGKI